MSVNHILSGISLTLVIAVSAHAQQAPGHIGSFGGTVEVIQPAGTAMATSGMTLSAPETIRTGSAAFADLVLGSSAIVTVEEQSQIEVRLLGASPVIWLERGTVRVASSDSNVQILTRSGLFSAVESPFEMEITNSGGVVNVVVTAGRIRTQDLDAATVTFGALENNAFRTYTAGTINRTLDATAAQPNVFVQTCVAPTRTPTSPAGPPSPNMPSRR